MTFRKYTAITDRYKQCVQFRIDRHPPVNSAELAALASAHLPQNFSIVRIHGVNHAGFLSGQQDIVVGGILCEYWWSTEVQVGTIRLWAARATDLTSCVVSVLLGELPFPDQLSAIQV